MSQILVMHDEMLGEIGTITFRNSIAPDPPSLDMGSVNSQNVAFQLTGGKTHPGMGRIGGRMRTTVHPDGTSLFESADEVFDGDHLLGFRIFFLPYAKFQGSAIDVG